MNQPNPNEASGKPKSRFPWLIVSIGCGVLLFAGIAVVAIFAFFIQRAVPKAAVMTAEAGIQAIEGSLIRYKTISRDYPTNRQGLDAFVQKPADEPVPENWRQLMTEDGLIDPWGRPYRYQNPGVRNPDSYDVWSAGPDGVDGTADDIIN